MSNYIVHDLLNSKIYTLYIFEAPASAVGGSKTTV